MMACGVIAVLLAKAVGWANGCAPDADTGAPCNWLTFWLRGAIVGIIVVPTVVIWRMRKARTARTNSE
jgi:heme/copper-type cytochrome/quinol oxidase subunit 2